MPADLEAVILQCLAKERDARPASAVALRAALHACADAARYDAAAASQWWAARRAGTPGAVKPEPISVTAPTMAIDLRGRHELRG